MDDKKTTGAFSSASFSVRETIGQWDKIAEDRVAEDKDSLLPCPKCGNPAFWYQSMFGSGRFHVQCASCAYETPGEHSVNASRKHWNAYVRTVAHVACPWCMSSMDAKSMLCQKCHALQKILQQLGKVWNHEIVLSDPFIVALARELYAWRKAGTWA